MEEVHRRNFTVSLNRFLNFGNAHLWIEIAGFQTIRKTFEIFHTNFSFDHKYYLFLRAINFLMLLLFFTFLQQW